MLKITRVPKAGGGTQPEPDLTDPDNPEWTEADFARAAENGLAPELYAHFPNTKNRGGRPKSAAPKKQVTLRLAPDVLEFFKATGDGWQVRMEEALRKAMKTGIR